MNILKIGYTSNLQKRNLNKEFGLSKNDIYLLMGFLIPNLTIEQQLHFDLKSLTDDYYEIEKKIKHKN